MGNVSSALDYKMNSDVYPHPSQPPKSDPLFGFPDGRTQKVMVNTEEELYSAKVPLDCRSYCSHHYLEFQKCRKANWPFVYRCHHQKHALLNCEYQEFVDRMKDCEREKRLAAREKRIEARGG